MTKKDEMIKNITLKKRTKNKTKIGEQCQKRITKVKKEKK